MPAASTIKGTVFQKGGAFLMARVIGNSGSYVQPGDFASITANVFDDEFGTSSPTLIPGIAWPVTAGTVSGSLITNDRRWTLDSIGYNFYYQAPASWFPNQGRTHRVEFTFTPVSGPLLYVVFELQVVNIYS